MDAWVRLSPNIRCSAREEDPDFGTQSHADHMHALMDATHAAIVNAGVDGHAIEAIALDTTGSSVVIVDENLEPLDDYYLWCDHRAWKEAAEITAASHARGNQGNRLVRRRLFF